uniref:Inositol polyphosphate-related phosphatase domain-containing protein n=1 Tax=Anabas testudineus TaxID=64144 RepID=A0A7N6B0X3_ANATE
MGVSLTTSSTGVHIITWNVGSATPPDDMTSLLGLNVGDGNTDMYIIGLQEVNSMINKRLKDVLFTDQWSEVCMERLSPFGYVLVTSQRMQGLLLLVFAKYFHLPFLRGVQTETTRTGLGGYWGNKGGVSARMSVFGHTICFLNCHLPAHMENSEQRMEDFESILQQQQFEGQAATGVLDHDVVFWFGDLNFRIDDLDMQVVKSAIDNNKFSIMWEKDQLNLAKDSETVLEGFQEGPLKFPPTYKFDIGTNTYDTSGKKRKPAWTDRILWRLRATAPAGAAVDAGKRSSISGLTSGTKVTQHSYRSHMEYIVSDHKPVSSIFTLQFPYKVDIPLVTLIVADEWNSVADATAKFKLAPNYSRSSWDWIGLYKVGFKHHKDYVGYVQGLAVPVHIRASTVDVAVRAAATVAAAVAPAALHKPKRRSSVSLMVLHPAPHQQLSASPQCVQQRAAAARHLLLLRKTNTWRTQECDALLVTGHIANCCVFYLIHSLYCMFSRNEKVQFMMPSFSGTAIWFVQRAYFALSCFIKLCTL